jgi:uncharacterized protein (DUF58 family)
VLTAVAAFFIASATRVGWVHLADAVLWGVVILSAISPWVSVYGLSVQRNRRLPSGSPLVNGAKLAGPVEGKSLDVDIQLVNRWWIPRFLLNVEYTVDSPRTTSAQSIVLVGVGPRALSRGTSSPKITTKGIHKLPAVSVEAKGLFGLFRRRRMFTAAGSVLAYPSWEHISRVGLLETSLGVSDGMSKSRSGSEVAGTRRYVAGDPYRNIHWRNSARTGRLAVKEFDSWSERSVAFVIDADTLPVQDPGDRPSDYAVRMADTAAAPLIESGGTVRVVTPKAGQIRTSWSDVMTDPARIEDQPAGTSTGWTEGVDAGERIIAFVHSSNFDLLSAIAAMSRTGSDVAAVVLEGFMPGDDAQHAVNMLAAVGASAMSCRLGELPRAMRMMEQGVSADGHQAQRTVVAAQAASVDVATEERAA